MSSAGSAVYSEPQAGDTEAFFDAYLGDVSEIVAHSDVARIVAAAFCTGAVDSLNHRDRRAWSSQQREVLRLFSSRVGMEPVNAATLFGDAAHQSERYVFLKNARAFGYRAMERWRTTRSMRKDEFVMFMRRASHLTMDELEIDGVLSPVVSERRRRPRSYRVSPQRVRQRQALLAGVFLVVAAVALVYLVMARPDVIQAAIGQVKAWLAPAIGLFD